MWRTCVARGSPICSNHRTMKWFLVSAFLLVAGLAQAAQHDEKVVVGAARFTVIAPECIRLEYAADGKFVDAKSMFAVGRDEGWHDFKLNRDGGNVVIDTGRIRLQYQPDGKPFTRENLHARVARGGEWVEWWPGENNKQNLGGTIRTLDRVKGPVDL